MRSMAARMVALLGVVAGLSLVGAAHAESQHPAMTDPSKATETAPDKFKAKFETSKGDIVFECTREWAPHGVDRFYNLVRIGFFEEVRFFRMLPQFVVQWGIHGNPKVSKQWRDANLPADPVKQSNTEGMLTYAMAGKPTTRSTQLFINFKNNSNLDAMGFAPICKVVEGMEVAKSFNAEHGPAPSNAQAQIQMLGNKFLDEKFPGLDYIKKTSIVGEEPLDTDGDGKDGGGEKKEAEEEGSNTMTYVVVGVGAAALVAFVMLRKKEEEPTPTKSAAKGKTGASSKSGASANKSGTSKRRKKRSAKAKSASTSSASDDAASASSAKKSKKKKKKKAKRKPSDKASDDGATDA